MKDIPAGVGTVTKLEEKRCQQAMDTTLGSILEVKVIVSHKCWSGLLHVLDVLNNGRTYPKYEFSVIQSGKRNCAPQDAFSGTRCKIHESFNKYEGRKGERSVRFPRTHNNEPFLFQSWNVLPWINHVAVPPC
jgi:hypothetical protein